MMIFLMKSAISGRTSNQNISTTDINSFNRGIKCEKITTDINTKGSLSLSPGRLKCISQFE